MRLKKAALQHSGRPKRPPSRPYLRQASVLLLLAVFISPLLAPAHASAGWGAEVRLSTGLASSNLPSIAVYNTTVIAVWEDFRDGDYEIYYKRSTNNGASWGPDTRLTNSAGTSTAPCVAIAGSRVHVVWIDDRDGGDEIYYKNSTDGGVTWNADTRLSTGLSVQSTGYHHDLLAISGTVVHVAWTDSRDGNNEIYYRRSGDGGVSWGLETRLTNNASVSEDSSISASGTNVNVVWNDNRDGNYEIYCKRSTNGGTSWGADTRLTNDIAVSLDPSVATWGGNIHVVWYDTRDTNTEIYYKHSLDGGATWSTDTRLTNNSSLSAYPTVGVSNTWVPVIWNDNRDGNWNIYCKSSADNGAVWSLDTRLSTTPLTADALSPTDAVYGNDLYVVWSDDRDGFPNIYYMKYTGPSTQAVQTATVETSLGPVRFQINEGNLYGLTWIDPNSLSCAPAGYIVPFGFFAFNIDGLSAGQSVTVTITVPVPLPVGATTYYKCLNGTTVDCTSLMTQNDPYNIVLTLTDGGLGDGDGRANNAIADPGGPCVPLNIVSPQITPSSSGYTSTPSNGQSSAVTVKSASLSSKQATVGEPITVTAVVANEGTGNATSTIYLYVNEREEASQSVTIASGGSTDVKFTVSRGQPGAYTVYVGKVQAGSFRVFAAGDINPIIFLIVGALASIIAVAAFIYIRKQQQPY